VRTASGVLNKYEKEEWVVNIYLSDDDIEKSLLNLPIESEASSVVLNQKYWVSLDSTHSVIFFPAIFLE
jgi:hypothetical protein